MIKFEADPVVGQVKSSLMGKSTLPPSINKVAPKSPPKARLVLFSLCRRSAEVQTQVRSTASATCSLSALHTNLEIASVLHCTAHRFSSATIRKLFISRVRIYKSILLFLTLAGPDLATCIHTQCCTTLKMMILAVGNNNERAGAVYKTITPSTTLLARQDGLSSRCPNDEIGMTYQ